MNYYIDITVLPDPEFNAATLMNAVFAKLHRVLINTAQGRLGVSFPHYKRTLGNVLRVHGVLNDLNALQAQSWLKGLGDYTRVSEVQGVPSSCQYRAVFREHAKSAHNKLNRSVRKGWLTEEEAVARLATENSKTLDLPFARVKSLSSGQQVRVFVGLGALQDQPVAGTFSSYGLSKNTTIPWF